MDYKSLNANNRKQIRSICNNQKNYEVVKDENEEMCVSCPHGLFDQLNRQKAENKEAIDQFMEFINSVESFSG